MTTPIIPISEPEPGEWIQTCSEEQITEQLARAGREPYALAVKANIAVKGLRRSAGNRLLDVAPKSADAPIVAALRRTGAVVVGTTNMHELAFGITSDNAAYGPVRLPGHPHHSAGGSSGGSAAAVARGSVEVALGTDTGGSISIPASHCGVAGFRPTTGRWPTAGLVGLSWTRDTPGLLARSIARIAQLDAQVVAGRETEYAELSGRPLRLGLPEELLANLASPTQQAFDDALRAPAHGIELIPVRWGGIDELCRAAAMPIVRWESRRLLAKAAASAIGTDQHRAFARLVTSVQSLDVRRHLEFEVSNPVEPQEYADAQAKVVEARARYAQHLSEHGIDAFIFPATPAPAPPLIAGSRVEHRGRRIDIFELYTRNTTPGTMLGAPMVTLPLPVPRTGLPVGLTVQGARFDDRRTLAIAQRLADHLGGD